MVSGLKPSSSNQSVDVSKIKKKWFQFIHGTNMKRCSMCRGQNQSRRPHHGAVGPRSILFQSALVTSRLKQLIPQCSAGLRSGLHNSSQTVEQTAPTLLEPTVRISMVDFGPRLWTSEVPAGCGAFQHVSACRLSEAEDGEEGEESQEIPPPGLTGYVHPRKYFQSI